MLHVNSNLVGTPGFESALYQVHVAKALQHLVVGNSMLTLIAFGEDIHLKPILNATANMPDDGALILRQITPNQRCIYALGGMIEELLGDVGVGKLVLGNYQNARRVLIDTVHQSGTHIAALKQRKILKVVGKRVHQGSGVVAMTGVHHHAGLLIYDDNVIILVKDIERNILWDDLQLPAGIWKHNRDGIERFYLVARLNRLTIYKDISGIGSALNAVARHLLHAVGKPLVDAKHALSLINAEAEMLVQARLLLFFLLFLFVNKVRIFVLLHQICRVKIFL